MPQLVVTFSKQLPWWVLLKSKFRDNILMKRIEHKEDNIAGSWE